MFIRAVLSVDDGTVFLLVQHVRGQQDESDHDQNSQDDTHHRVSGVVVLVHAVRVAHRGTVLRHVYGIGGRSRHVSECAFGRVRGDCDGGVVEDVGDDVGRGVLAQTDEGAIRVGNFVDCDRVRRGDGRFLENVSESGDHPCGRELRRVGRLGRGK